jgi:hypothetical protein
MSLHKVRFRQSGGYGGLVRGCELTATDMSPDEFQQLERLLNASGLTKSAAGGGARTPPSAADLMQYDLDIETSDGKKQVVLTDDGVDEKTQPLIEFLQKRSKPMKP